VEEGGSKQKRKRFWKGLELEVGSSEETKPVLMEMLRAGAGVKGRGWGSQYPPVVRAVETARNRGNSPSELPVAPYSLLLFIHFIL
jgi:hypothetical protein